MRFRSKHGACRRRWWWFRRCRQWWFNFHARTTCNRSRNFCPRDPGSPPSLSPRIAVSILTLHGSVCPRACVPACAASHPGQPGVKPCFISSTLRMYTRLGSGAAVGGGSGGKSTSRTRGAGATATSTSAPTCGSGHHGTPHTL